MTHRFGAVEVSAGRYHGPGRRGEGFAGLTWIRLVAGWHLAFTLGHPRLGVHVAWWRNRP